jgi:hypothetical protein
MAALLEDDEPLLVEVPLPLALPPSLVEAWSVAHCEPSPLRPGPLPAPSVKNCCFELAMRSFHPKVT